MLKISMAVLRKLKRSLYFFVASYFAFWAGIFLRKWKPEVITVIGSSGKTTLLHLLEAQLGTQAVYSHKANSAFGISFNILGLERKTFAIWEWPLFAILAPFKTLRKIPEQKIYVTEADAERPNEGRFLAKLLQPDAVIWLSLEEAHGINFDAVAKQNSAGTDVRDGVKKAMAEEFGFFIQYAKKYSLLNLENTYIATQTKRTTSEIISISEKDAGAYSLPYLVPPAAKLSVSAVIVLLQKLGFPIDREFKNFTLPPGRSSVFEGKKNTVLIDSTYNATMDGVRTMLDLFNHYPAKGEKWLVLGDMIEQGKSEEMEHIDLAKLVLEVSPARVVMVGPRLQKYTFPLVQKSIGIEKAVSFLMPREALEYLEKELVGGETILFKGARYLEGVVERLLANSADASKLCRREAVYIAQRKKWNI